MHIKIIIQLKVKDEPTDTSSHNKNYENCDLTFIMALILKYYN